MIHNSLLVSKKKAPHNPLIFYGGGAKNGSFSCLLKLFIH